MVMNSQANQWIQAWAIGLTMGLIGIPMAQARAPLGVVTQEGSVAQLKADGIRYHEQGFQNLAIEAYREAISIEDRGQVPAIQRDPDVPFNLGLIYLQQGKLAEARSVFQRSVEADPSNFQSVYQLGVTELRMGNQVAARQHLIRLEAASRDNVEMKEHLGSLMALLDPVQSRSLSNSAFTDESDTRGSRRPQTLSPEASQLTLPGQEGRSLEFRPASPSVSTLEDPPTGLERIRNRDR